MTITSAPLIEVTGLRKTYAGRAVVDGVSFGVREGEIFGILGPNGAGKTTTVECVEGLRTADEGSVRVAGLDPVRDHAKVTGILGAQLQESEIQAKLTVREALELYASFYPDPLDWGPLAERLRLNDKLTTRFAKLSGGQKQRLFIALALVGNPRVVVLDELTTGLDPRSRRDTWQLIEDVRDSGVTVLLVTHFMEEAQRLCDRIAVIDQGKVAALDTPEGLIRQAAGATVISFTPSAPLPQAELAALPALASVAEKDGRFTLTGGEETVDALLTLLARHHITAHQLRVADATLDDAFLDLTGAGQS
ncbi:ATP-binding cassette domain-containing protein [Streptomyces sp. SID5785]|uniref:ABC transporter ATP-binding protein n=1 Tax=Streptomyces sp. SID5785 TaxID=2690309 RepID=UPI0013616D00|nr:ABC transporter ATP-binding protein [Streptomyces sp. SID5785]MZD09504.1 ATP-binding cassette domain-containing protein [Streptomyces sp. SID5785]